MAQRVYHATTSGGPYFLVMSFADNTTNSYTDIGLTNGTRYYYVVWAFDGSQESANSNKASAVPIDNIPPVISNLAVTNILMKSLTITGSRINRPIPRSNTERARLTVTQVR